MKKIVYIGGFELPDKNAAAQRVSSNAKLLRAAGYPVEIIGVDTDISFEDGLMSSDSENISVLAYPGSKSEWVRYLFGRKTLISHLISQAGDIGVIVFYNYPSLATWRIIRQLRNHKIKVLLDITEWYSSRGNGLVFSAIKWLDTNLRINLLSKGVDGIITTSSYMSDYYRSRSKLVLELPTLYDTHQFICPNIDSSDLVKLVYAGNPFDISRASKDRNSVKERLDILVTSLCELSNEKEFELSIYGVSKKDYLTVYPEHAALLQKNGDRVCFKGKRPFTEVIENIRCCHFSVFFRDENQITLAGFPSKLAESMSLGTPVITSSLSNNKKFESLVGLFLADHGQEKSILGKCIDMPQEEIISLKKAVFEEKAFDFREYLAPTKEFFDQLHGD